MNTLNDKTLQYYQNHAAEYTNSTLAADMSMNRNQAENEDSHCLLFPGGKYGIRRKQNRGGLRI